MTTLADTLNARLAEIKDGLYRRSIGEVVNPFISTGLKSWDRNGGIMKGILTVIGGATGDGKSVVKLQLARGAAKDLTKVCMIDFEDPGGKTADRVFSGITGINNKLLGLLDIEDFDFKRLESANKEIAEWAPRVDHHVGLLDTKHCLKIMRETDAELILVDYAQAFPEDDDKTMERTIAEFAWTSNEIAQKKNCAIVVFSQVIREVEQRGYRVHERAKFKDPAGCDVSGFCPTGLSDISWAKSLGERSKCLLYIWREHRIARKLGANVRDDRLRIISGKVNFGEELDILLKFDGPTASLKDWA